MYAFAYDYRINEGEASVSDSNGWSIIAVMVVVSVRKVDTATA